MTNESQAKVISGFPGVGKSVLFHMHASGVIDSDSSSFSWRTNGTRNPQFPRNYVKHIQSQIKSQDIILVSSHEVVRNALIEEGVSLTIVYPERDLKAEYLERYRRRGNTEEFIEMMDKNWDKFLDGIEMLEGTEGVTLLPLKSNVFLADVIKEVR